MKKMFKILFFIVVLFGSFSVPLVCGKKKKRFGQRYECEYCEKSFSHKGDLNRHIRDACKKSPNASSRKGYPCESCGKGFSAKRSLDRHIRDVCMKEDLSCDLFDEALAKEDRNSETQSVLGKRKRPAKIKGKMRVEQEDEQECNDGISYLLKAAELLKDFEPQLKRRKLLHENVD